MDPIENMYRIAGDPQYSDTHRDLAARAIARAGSADLNWKSAADGNDHGIEWHSCKAGVFRSVLESMDHLEDVHAPIVVDAR